MAFREWPELRQLNTHGWLEGLRGAVLSEQKSEVGNSRGLQVLGLHAEDLRAWGRCCGAALMRLDLRDVDGLE